MRLRESGKGCSYKVNRVVSETRSRGLWLNAALVIKRMESSCITILNDRYKVSNQQGVWPLRLTLDNTSQS